jgi:hypothetical protein
VASSSRLPSLLLLLAVLLSSASCALVRGGDGARQADLSSAIERAARYFESRPLRGDVGFLIAQGSTRLSPGFERWSADLKPDPVVLQAMENPKRSAVPRGDHVAGARTAASAVAAAPGARG